MKITSCMTAVLLGMSASVAHAAEPHAYHAPAFNFDKRIALSLTDSERAMILQEMHLFLAGVQQLTGALGKQDMAAAAQSARKLGLAMVHDVPPSLRAKLPAGFRQLGSSVHRDFDQIAMDAETLKDVSHTLGQVSATLQKCASCHATYQIKQSVLPLKR